MLHSDLAPQRILIFGSSIFEEGIAHLLTQGLNLQVSCAKYTNELAFLDEVAQNRPDVVLLNETTPLNPAYIFKLLFARPDLANLRIIVTRLSSNVIDVYMLPKQVVARNGYERQQFNVMKPVELVAVVRG